MTKKIFHKGELKIQEITGEQSIASRTGRIITSNIIPGAVNFIEESLMVIAGSMDKDGKIWTSVLVSEQRFTTVLNLSRLSMDRRFLKSMKTDVFFRNIRNNPEVGLLYIDFMNRTRYRVNGKIQSFENTIEINVREAYPNCPKYIQRRILKFSEDTKGVRPIQDIGFTLTTDDKKLIRSADTFFVGSSSKRGSMDVSHRGGNPGFIEVLNKNTIKIPDYIGNGMYNTLGNFVENSNAGLIFIDFQKGSILQLIGTVVLLFNQESPNDLEQSTGTGRYWLFEVEKRLFTKNHHPAYWDFIDNSSFNP